MPSHPPADGALLADLRRIRVSSPRDAGPFPGPALPPPGSLPVHCRLSATIQRSSG